MDKVSGKNKKQTIKPSHDIATPTIKELQQELQEIVAEKPSELVVDLDQVKFIDSTGIGLLIATFNSLKKHKGTVSLINAKDHVLDVLIMMHLDHIFSIPVIVQGKTS